MFARPLSLLATAAVTAALLVGAPGSAEAKKARTWSIPSTVSVKDVSGLSNAELEEQLMVRINAVRASKGLRKIWNFDTCTDRLAERWGRHIATTGRFEHRDQQVVIRHCGNQWAGETLVRGVGLTPEQMVELWLDSPPHREILLSPQARRAGVDIRVDSQRRVIGVVNLVRHR